MRRRARSRSSAPTSPCCPAKGTGPPERPQLFCTPGCRRSYEHARIQLLLDEAASPAGAEEAGRTFRERQLVKAALASVQSCLKHFAGVSPLGWWGLGSGMS